jgi:predicted RecA/RadA family phage recombinase
MINFVQRGATLTVLAPYVLTSGAGCRVGNIFGVAVNNQAQGDSSEIVLEGVFDLAKDSSTFASGDLVYWDNVAKAATSTVGSNLLIGQATLDQASGTDALGGASGDATVRVRLFGVPGFSGQVNGLRVAHALYDYTVDGGVSCTPAQSDTIPAKAVVHGGVINSTVAPTAAGNATVAIGTTAGSANNSILTATAIASLSLDAVVKPTCTTTPFKMSAAGQISVTIATGPLTAGQIEVWVIYQLASNA